MEEKRDGVRNKEERLRERVDSWKGREIEGVFTKTKKRKKRVMKYTEGWKNFNREGDEDR